MSSLGRMQKGVPAILRASRAFWTSSFAAPQSARARRRRLGIAVRSRGGCHPA
jgi:hypothetical protein